MILKGNSRKGGAYLVSHMLNETDNDHVEVHEVRGFSSEDFETAVYEVDAIAKGTKCEKNFFSLSLNPPAHANVSEQDYLDAIEQCEKALGLIDQPRAIIFHEKEGRRHCHVIWSRIDADRMQAIPDSFSRLKLREVSKKLFLQHGWELPEGLVDKDNASPTTSLDEQAILKRSALTREDHEKLIADAWQKSDDATSFAAALESQGYILACGDKGRHVAVDVATGDVHSIARRLHLRKKEIEAKLGAADQLPSLEEARKLAEQRRQAREAVQAEAKEKEDKYHKQLKALKKKQISERNALLHRQKQELESQERSFVAQLQAALKSIFERSKAEMARLRDKWLGKDNDAEHAARIVELRKSQAERFADERDLLRAEHMHQRRELQRPLLAERYVNRQEEIAQRCSLKEQAEIAKRQAEIQAKLHKDRLLGRKLDR